MGQEEIFPNTVIEMYHKTKQVTNPPLPSEVTVIKKSYPGMKWSSPWGEESCFKCLYVTVWILHMGVSLKAVFFSHDAILCFAYECWWISSIRLSSDFRKLEKNKMKRKPKQSLTFPWYEQEWLFLPASYVFIFPSFTRFENRHWDPKVLTSLSLFLIIYWRKTSVCSPFYTLFAVCLWEWKMRQRAIDETLDPLKARGVLPLTCLGSQFCPKSFISVLYNARQLSKLMPSGFIRLTWSDFNSTKPELLASEFRPEKKPILTQNVHTFVKVCKWFLVWIHIENVPNSFGTSSVLQSDMKGAGSANCELSNLKTLLLPQQFFTITTTIIWLSLPWIYTWNMEGLIFSGSKH